MDAITFLTASFFFSFLSLFNSDLSSNISPFLVVVKYFESVILKEVDYKQNIKKIAMVRIIWNKNEG